MQASDLNKVENSRLCLLLQIVCLQHFYVSMLHYVLYLVVEKVFSLLILKFHGRSNQVDFSSDEFFLRNWNTRQVACFCSSLRWAEKSYCFIKSVAVFIISGNFLAKYGWTFCFTHSWLESVVSGAVSASFAFATFVLLSLWFIKSHERSASIEFSANTNSCILINTKVCPRFKNITGMISKIAAMVSLSNFVSSSSLWYLSLCFLTVYKQIWSVPVWKNYLTSSQSFHTPTIC